MRTDSRGHRLPPERADQGESWRYRLRFTKLEGIRLTSQLDLARTLPRVLRRAGLKLKYSSGFSPKPLMAYGPALPLGVSSLAEVVDVEALEDLAPGALLTRLEPVSDLGMHFYAAGRLAEEARSCARTMKIAGYWVGPGLGAAALAPEELARATSRALGSEPIELEVLRKKGPRTIDVRRGLVAMTPSPLTAEEATRLGWPEGSPLPLGLRWTVDLDEGASVRATEMARALLKAPAEGLLFVRVSLELKPGKGATKGAPSEDYSRKSSIASSQASASS